MADPCPSRSPDGYRCCLSRGHSGDCYRAVYTYPLRGWSERELLTWPRVRLLDPSNEETRR